MEITSIPQRVLSLDLRAQRFGYVVFEGPKQILDWGTYVYGKLERSSFRRRLTNLFHLFRPALVLAQRRTAIDKENNRKVQIAVDTVAVVASEATIPLQVVGEEIVRRSMQDPSLSKHYLAQEVTSRFPELAWRLPPKRKQWQSQRVRLSIFDAACLGLYYFSQNA